MRHDPVSEEDLEFIERNLFHQFDEAYRKYHLDDYPNYDEVVALENALKTIGRIRRHITMTQDTRRRRTTRAVTDALAADK